MRLRFLFYGSVFCPCTIFATNHLLLLYSIPCINRYSTVISTVHSFQSVAPLIISTIDSYKKLIRTYDSTLHLSLRWRYIILTIFDCCRLRDFIRYPLAAAIYGAICISCSTQHFLPVVIVIICQNCMH